MSDQRTQMARTATALLREDPTVAVVLAQISLGYFGEAVEAAPERVIDVGIMEQTMIGVAAGFALEGFHPIAHSIGPFIAERPLEQIKDDFGYQELGGTFTSTGASYDYAAEGGTHHAPGDVQALGSIPGMQILLPGHGDEVDRLLRATYANEHPTYLRLSVASNAEPFDVEPGRMHVVRRGSEITIVAFGPMLARALEAATDLDASVLYATSLVPFDDDVLAAVAGDRPLVAAIEPFYEGTSVAAISNALRQTPARIVPIGVPRTFLRSYGTPADHDRALGLDAAGIRGRLLEALGG